ncbi:acyl-CoA dehydrogenase family protein [Pseudolysinimonas kribbensis]|uniref:acyl-CoA dehydrogenase family protein n=1 Tax=Pseudolysinimonas kribbensis TaxID=433641 RepID=UPI0031DC8B4D
MATHEVTNQPRPRVDVDEYGTNIPLVEAVYRHDAAWAEDRLHETGRYVGTQAFQDDAERANINTPQLHQFDRYGTRIDEVEYDESYHRVIAAALKRGAHASAYNSPGPGAEVARAATFMLFAQVEPGHACPVSMTHSAVASIRHNSELAETWVPRLLSTDYAPDLRLGKKSALFGMAMTEKQGGSDIRANTTQAVKAQDHYVLTGHKWFCSAPMSDGFLVLAQTDKGVTCFLVPRVLPDNSRNAFAIQRLKDKLGNKSNASSEVEFDGTVGFLVGEEGRGVRTIIDMVSGTRLDSMLGSTAGMRQATAEAVWHVRHRAAFGRTLIDQPAMTAVVADLALETEAATATAMRVARAYDADAGAEEQAFRRIATAVSKYWICKRGPGHAYEALECLGGNGYTEAFPLARRYREQPVMAIWEGSGNVIALDLIRALNTEPDAVTAFIDEVALAAGQNPVFDEHLAITEQRAREAADLDPITAAANARGLMADLALALEASLLIRHAPAAVADLFVESRLGEGARYGHLYGALPAGGDLAAILERS